MPGKFDIKILLLLSLGHLVTDIYQGALPAILPFLKDHLDLTYTAAGVILMTANFTSSLVQPVFGYISDKKGKAFLLPLGCLLAGAGLALVPLSPVYGWTLLLVIISGLGIASYHPEGYKTASFFIGDKQVTGMAVFSVGGNLGFAIGPVLAIFLINYLGFQNLPVIIVPAILFVVLLLAFWKRIHFEAAGKTAPHPAPDKIETGGVYLTLFTIILIVVMRSWTQLGLMTYIPFYYINHLKGDPLYAGQLVSIFLLGGAAGTLLGAPLADRWGHKLYLSATMLLSSFILPLVFVSQGIWLFIVLGLLGMVIISTFSVTIVMAQTLMPRNLGIASGIMVGFAIGAGGICVTLLGVVADHYGVPLALKSITVLPFIGFLLTLTLKYEKYSARPLMPAAHD
ncbi:MAG: MFS transporter [Syntrophaceae bacterium]